MDWMPEWMTGWPFLVGMFVVLVGLVVVLMIVRNKRPEDD